MPVFRRPDGKIVEEQSRKASGEGRTRIEVEVPQREPEAMADDHLDRKTKLMRGGHHRNDDGKTMLFGRRRRGEEVEKIEAAAEQADAMDDPVVGWLVVIGGPGKGRALNVGLGRNDIGRSPESRVALAFGDTEISSEEHAVLTYDPRGRKFWLQQGKGRNLTYLGDTPVLEATELSATAHISIGGTTLRFVPLCGQEFDWQDLDESA